MKILAAERESLIYMAEDVKKVTGNFKHWTVTQTNFAQIIGVSVPRVNQLIEEGIVHRNPADKSGGVLLIQSLKDYVAARNAKNSTDDNDNGDAVFWKERGLHERAKRKTAELKLKKAEGAVYDALTVEMAFTEMLTMLRTHLLGLPSKFAVQLEGKNRNEIYDILTKEIESKLFEMSESYNEDEFRDEINSDGED